MKVQCGIIVLLFAATSGAVPEDFRTSLNSGVFDFFNREDKSTKFEEFLPKEAKFIPKLIGDTILAEWAPRLSPVRTFFKGDSRYLEVFITLEISLIPLT